MTNDEAKFILQSYRHNGADADDPVFREALEQSRRDPELSKWLAEEFELDAAITQKLKSVSIPAELKSNILAGGKIVMPAVWWKHSWLAAAASFVLLIGVGAVFLPSFRQPHFAAFRDSMIAHAQHDTKHVTFARRDLAGIEQWFASQNMKANFDLPNALNKQIVHGCRVVDWNNQKVAFICFMLDGKEHADLFVIDQTRFQGFTPSKTPRFEQHDELVTAIWNRDGKTYMLAGKGTRETFEKFL